MALYWDSLRHWLHGSGKRDGLKTASGQPHSSSWPSTNLSLRERRLLSLQRRRSRTLPPWSSWKHTVRGESVHPFPFRKKAVLEFGLYFTSRNWENEMLNSTLARYRDLGEIGNNQRQSLGPFKRASSRIFSAIEEIISLAWNALSKCAEASTGVEKAAVELFSLGRLCKNKTCVNQFSIESTQGNFLI